ncbi:unnamed protein product [Nesidiocoris tenuis]|uniref:Uncharacterized protein n=1 Tax=Nesidiocoris tenuis TaxID=355587 RepID=A0A6H5G7G2_9HEMI|nr:unnamed protein product [Nesidiocoris tenuis]
MVPSTGVVEEKPPPVPVPVQVSKGHLQLELTDQQPAPAAAGLTNGHAPKRIIKTQSKSSTLSAESSASSISSVLSEVPGTHSGTPSQDRPKHKLVSNGQQPKHPTLKSFNGFSDNPASIATKVSMASMVSVARTIPIATMVSMATTISKAMAISLPTAVSMATTVSIHWVPNCPRARQSRHARRMTSHTQGTCNHRGLARVSFGSSKGSMVETLIYESPLQEEPELSPSADQGSIDSAQGRFEFAANPATFENGATSRRKILFSRETIILEKPWWRLGTPATPFGSWAASRILEIFFVVIIFIGTSHTHFYVSKFISDGFRFIHPLLNSAWYSYGLH